MPENAWITVYSTDGRGKVTHHYYCTSWGRAEERCHEVIRRYPHRQVGIKPWNGEGPYTQIDSTEVA